MEEGASTVILNNSTKLGGRNCMRVCLYVAFQLDAFTFMNELHGEEIVVIQNRTQ